MNVHLLIHEYYEGPGAIQMWLDERAHSVTYSRVYKGDPLPEEVNFELLIVLGGPQSPYTTEEECSYYKASAEMELIRNTIDAGKKVIGICLGAQLISNALGGATIASPNKEIGLFPVTLNSDGKSDQLFQDFPEVFPSGHWHGDMPGLSDNAVVLASSSGCPRQIIRFADGVYGFQCHLEFTPDAIENMIVNCGHELADASDYPFIQSEDQLRGNNYSDSNSLLFTFLNRLMQ